MKAKTLLKLKYLFFASHIGKIDVRDILQTIGVNICPYSFRQLRELTMSSDAVETIDSLYDSIRRVEMTDPVTRSHHQRIKKIRSFQR